MIKKFLHNFFTPMIEDDIWEVHVVGRILVFSLVMAAVVVTVKDVLAHLL